MAERVTLYTTDEVKIIGDWVTSPTTLGAAILLHMYPATRQSWSVFQAALAARGIASLAIDLRGHGESTKGQEGVTFDYKKFKPNEHATSIHDVRAAYDWVRKRGIERDHIVAVGASIGANLALQFASEEPMTAGAVLLSPGVDYHGIQTLDTAPYVQPEQAVFIAASSGDDDDSVKSSKAIMEALLTEKKTFKQMKQVGHGTAMFDKDKQFMNEVADWIRELVIG